MAEDGEKRDPSSHRTPKQIKRLQNGYNRRPEQLKARTQRTLARRQLIKEGVVAKGDGKDVHHKKPIRSGGTNARSNLAVASQKTNRGWNRKKGRGKRQA